MSKKLFFLAPLCALLLILASCSLFSDVSDEKDNTSVIFTIDSRTAQNLLRQAGIDLSDSTRASMGDLQGLYINLSLRGQLQVSQVAQITSNGVTIAFANVPAGLSVYAYAEIYSDPSNVLYKGKSDNITIIQGFNNLTVKIMNATAFNTRYPDEPANTNTPAAPAPGSGGNNPGNGGNTPGSGEGGNNGGNSGNGENGSGGNGGGGSGGNGNGVVYPPDPDWFTFQSTAQVLAEGTIGENDKLAPHLKANPAARYVYFGNYPRSHIASGVTIDETTAESHTFGNFTYYKGSDDEWYAKFKVKGNSGRYASDTPGAQGSSVENAGTVAYFKLEPIKWRVITTNFNNTGYALLITDEAIPGYFDYDADTTGHKRFSYSNHVDTNRSIGGNTSVGYSNYQYSNARAWLNGLDGSSYGMQDWTDAGFINSAFTEAGRMKIKEVVVDNSAASCYQPYETVGSTYNSYLSENTTDKVFLLSKREVTNQLWGFDEATDMYGTRCFVPTDLAIASGVWREEASNFYYGCYCYLRTPCSSGIEMTCDGNGYVGNGETAYNDYNNAMVPAICVDLNDLTGEAIGDVGLPNTSVDSHYALPGTFTVNASGKQVKFSLGNLENTQETGVGNITYHFAQRQSFYCRNYTGTKFHIDLMSYGHLSDANSGGIAESDVTTWRVLTDSEWQYLLETRSGAASKFGVAQVIGLNGLVILPDDWTLPAGLTFNSGYASDSQEFKDKNQYTAMQWDKMEKAGAVFLPACGTTNLSGSSYVRSSNTLNVYGGYHTGSGTWMQFSKSAVSYETCAQYATHNIRCVMEVN